VKNRIHIQILTLSILFVTPAFAANPFLDAKDDRPVSANFRGTEWNDENIQGEIPLSDECIYLTSHDSGHFGKFVWKPAQAVFAFTAEETSAPNCVPNRSRMCCAESMNGRANRTA